MSVRDYRYQITRNGRRVGWILAEYHGTAEWAITDDPARVSLENPCPMEQLDEALYAAGLEVMPSE